MDDNEWRERRSIRIVLQACGGALLAILLVPLLPVIYGDARNTLPAGEGDPDGDIVMLLNRIPEAIVIVLLYAAACFFWNMHLANLRDNERD